MKKAIFIFLAIFLILSFGEAMKIELENYGKLEDGRIVKKSIIENENGIRVEIISYGGIITKIIVPDKNNKFSNIVLGFDSLNGYLKNTPYFGAIIGRYANRIKDAEFELFGEKYFLYKNDGENSLHGGLRGFDKRLWNMEIVKGKNAFGVKLSYLSKDGEEGYPGNLKVNVFYTLNNKNELKIEYKAKTDKPTIINLTNHSYFNLKDGGKTNILSHILKIDADYFTEVDENLIPTGKLLNVSKTPYDFRKPKAVGKDIKKVKGGYDINYVLKKRKGLSLVAELYSPQSGRVLLVYTTQPGLQFYSGNFLDGKIKGHDGIFYKKHAGLCLETQHFPDSPHHKNFPSTLLMPGETFRQITVYKFGVKDDKKSL